jgi:hypothetical protein
MMNIVLEKMLRTDGMALTAENYVLLAYFGTKRIQDLEGEEIADLVSFESDVAELLGEETE